MATFETLDTLPIGDQLEIARIQAISAEFRTDEEVAFLAARQLAIDNTILITDADGLILSAEGDSTPDNYEGFRLGCLFFVINENDRNIYLNVGSSTNAIWSLVSRGTVNSQSPSA